ncbi:hypothetical protein XH98_13775 [Bradyrhizobium sp. CCBAU 51745]|nr:hypothetical protein [Bradyrhizobium sp. CCBAU 51745]
MHYQSYSGLIEPIVGTDKGNVRLEVPRPKRIPLVVARLSDTDNVEGFKRVEAGAQGTDRTRCSAGASYADADMTSCRVDLRSRIFTSWRHGHETKIFRRDFDRNRLFTILEPWYGAPRMIHTQMQPLMEMRRPKSHVMHQKPPDRILAIARDKKHCPN